MNPYQSYEPQGLAKGKQPVPEPAAAWGLLAAFLFVVIFKLLGKNSK